MEGLFPALLDLRPLLHPLKELRRPLPVLPAAVHAVNAPQPFTAESPDRESPYRSPTPAIAKCGGEVLFERSKMPKVVW